MKTSKILSAIAISFFIVATLTATASGEIIKTIKSKSIHTRPACSSVLINTESMHTRQAEYNRIVTEVASSFVSDADLSYLKFNVSNCANESVAWINEGDAYDAQFDYLKFNISDFSDNDAYGYESMGVPITVTDYLKFNVNNFIDADAVNQYEITELPADEFSYLKFNVNTYTSVISENIAQIELPVSE
jgi:hypothetical protein